MEPFAEDLPQVITRAGNSGVSTIISVGTDLESSKKAIELAQGNKGIYAAVGIHPHEAQGVSRDNVSCLVELSDHRKVVALGEMGLDFYRNYSPREEQLQVFDWQLALASELGLPIIVHCRQAKDDILPILREWSSHRSESANKIPGLIHSFDGDASTLGQYLDIGFYVALGAYIGYPEYRYMQEVTCLIPGDRLVVETDSPLRPPQIYRGQRNEPSYITFTVEALSQIRGETTEQIARQTTENALKLFNIPPAHEQP
jgi:TatD DNase family protein